MALVETVKNVLLLRQVQAFTTPTMNIYTINIMEDNQGAINMGNNTFSSKRTRRTDMKRHLFAML